MIWDLGIIWEWKYDERFVKLLDSLCYKKGKKSYLVSTYNLHETIEKVTSGHLKFKTILDRATDCNIAFMPFLHLLQKQQCRIIDNLEKTARASDKAIMHLEFSKAGLKVPKSIILFPKDEFKEEMLKSIGIPFVIKPALGGGGEGVIMGASSIADIMKVRAENPNAVFFIQNKITPRESDGRRCWFRVFFVCGRIIPCFWDNLTHIFGRLSSSDEKISQKLIDITKKINKLTDLEFFSTEITQLQNGDFVVVDYANDQCDLRFQSDAPDGIPDSIVEEIAEAIITTL